MARSARPPDFYGIGAMRGGTTWLYEKLNELSAFALPPVKEIHYFDRDPRYPSPSMLSKTRLGERLRHPGWPWTALRDGGSHLRRGNFRQAAWIGRWHLGHYTDAWYLSLFASLPGITGDITPSYSILDDADVAHMRRLAPDARLVMLLRDPIERAWSHYRTTISKRPGRAPSDPDTDAEIISLLTSEAWTRRSDYLRTIDTFSRHFPAGRLVVGFYDAIVQQPRALLGGIVTFLGGDPAAIDRECRLEARVNKAPDLDIPPAIAAHLHEQYRATIAALAQHFGGYCAHWEQLHYGTGDAGPRPAAPPAPFLLL